MAISKLSPKDPAETVLVTFDFNNNLTNIAEVITAVLWEATVISGVDPTPNNIFTGVQTFGSGVTTGLVTGGVAGVLYQIVVTITTSYGQIIKSTSQLKVEVQS